MIKNIFFSSKYCNNISKYLELSKNIFFNAHRKNYWIKKYIFITISFYHNIFLSQCLFIAILCAKMSSVLRPLNINITNARLGSLFLSTLRQYLAKNVKQSCFSCHHCKFTQKLSSITEYDMMRWVRVAKPSKMKKWPNRRQISSKIC